MDFNAALFDLDGTLLDTLGDLADACNYALRTLHYPEHPESAYRHFVGNGVRMLCLRILPEKLQSDSLALEELLHIYNERYRSHLFDRTRPYPGIPELLTSLRNENIPLAIVSNKPDPFTRSIADQFFLGLFNEVAGQQGTLTKPDPTGVNQILSRLGIPPEKALYVGDSGVDMQTARNSHTHGCGVTWGFRDESELRANGAEFIVHTPQELWQLLQNRTGFIATQKPTQRKDRDL